MKNIFLLALFFSVSFFAQERNNLPEFSQASPQAYQMTKYGDVPVNESSGKVNVSIPIYNYKAGHLSLPIGLSYMANGVKVDQMTTWTGIHWTLQAGGVITRNIKDLPDYEDPTQRSFLKAEDLAAMNLTDGSQDSETVALYFKPGYNLKDEGVDIFTFSFTGGSGSFYLNELGEPILTNNTNNLRINILDSSDNVAVSDYNDEITSNNNLLTVLANNEKFLITDARGIKYYFGGSNAIENSFTYNGHLGPSAGQTSKQGTTAYYITKIVHPYGDEIYFEYDGIGVQDYIMQKSQTISKLVATNYETLCVTGGNGDETDPCYPLSHSACPNLSEEEGFIDESMPPPSFYDYYRNRIGSGRLLKKITSNTSSIDISFITSSNNENNNQINYAVFKDKLDDIVISEGNNELFTARLDYLFPQGTVDYDKYFLEEVLLDYPNETDDQLYKLEYKIPDPEVNEFSIIPELIPYRFSFDQDDLGYYNAAQNTTYIPKTHGSTFQINQGLASKHSNFEMASIGVLQKIIYPTGGHTFFEYEADQAMGLINDARVSLRVNTDVRPYDFGGIYTQNIYHNHFEGFYFYENHETSFVPSHPFLLLPETIETYFPPITPAFNQSFGVEVAQDIQVFFGGSPIDPQHRKFIVFQLKDITTGEVFEEVSRNVCCPLDPVEYHLEAGHEYIAALYMRNSGSVMGVDTDIPGAEGFASFAYNKNGYTSDDAGGIRIKRITDYTKEGKPENIKRFYYKKTENINKISDESKIRLPIPDYSYTTTTTSPCYVSGPSGGDISSCALQYWVRGHQTSVNQLTMSPSTDHSAVYKYVTTSYGGDLFEKGGTQKHFAISQDNIASLFTEPDLGYRKNKYSDNTGVLDAKLTEKIDYVNKGGNLFSIKKENYTWQESVVNYVPNMVGQWAYDDCMSRTIGNLHISFYNIKSYRQEQTSKTIINYIEPLAIGADENSVKKVITTIDYEYGIIPNLPIKTTSTGNNGIKQIVKKYYPGQNANAVNLEPILTTEEEEAINNLRLANIRTPIQVESYERIGDNPEIMLSAQRSLYKEENNLTVLKSVLSSKNSSDFEERVVYHKYDTQGNPLELSKADGTKVVYMWATTHRKPLAKIINTSLPEVQAVTGDLRTDLPNAQVTTYTYTGPLNLLSTITDPRGYTTTYFYDEYQRLKYVKDAEGNILSKNEYVYRPQN